MSSIGHVYDMIRRDKENRELRKKFGNRNTVKDQCVLKSDKGTKNVSIIVADDIRGKIDSKHKQDEYLMGRSVFIVLLCGVVIVLLSYYMLSAVGWL